MTVGKYYVISVVCGEAIITRTEEHSTTAVQFFKDLQKDLATCNAVYFQDGKTYRQCTTRDIENITREVITGYETKAAKSLWGKWFGWLFNFFSHNRLLALRNEMMESPAFGWGDIQGQVNALLKSEPDEGRRREIFGKFETNRGELAWGSSIYVRRNFVISIKHLITEGSQRIYNEMVMDILRQRVSSYFDNEMVEELFDLVVPGNDQAMKNEKRNLQKEFYKSWKITPLNLDNVDEDYFSRLFSLPKLDEPHSWASHTSGSEGKTAALTGPRLSAFTEFLIALPNGKLRLLNDNWDYYNDILTSFATTVLDVRCDRSRELAERLVKLVDPRGNVRIEVFKEKLQERIDTYAKDKNV